MVFDPRFLQRFYVADTQNLYATRDQGLSFINLVLPTGFSRPTATEFISNNGVNALLVGGLNTVANGQTTITLAQSTITVADSDASGNLSSLRMFGQGLPNAQVGQLAYNPAADVLAVGTWGRGVFALYDVTSYFPQALTLQFGLADNDSMPDASFLTNGTVGNRALIKYGAADHRRRRKLYRRHHDQRRLARARHRRRRRQHPRQRRVLRQCGRRRL
jgi:hypothetical protein